MSGNIDRLLEIMGRLRDPEHGCPWDLEQNFRTIVPHTIEEAYEVADAIESGDMVALKDELGDLLFQVVFYAQLAKERGVFDFDAIAGQIADKMLRRHPHVFAEAEIASAEDQSRAWEEQKARERQAKALREGRAASALEGVSPGLPALTRALKLQKRAARVGFDWTEAEPILDKLAEEIAELRAEMAAPRRDPARLADEAGDMLFVVVNLCRHLELDPESALRGTNAKFERRFRAMEKMLADDDRSMEATPLEQLEALWRRAKSMERSPEPDTAKR